MRERLRCVGLVLQLMGVTVANVRIERAPPTSKSADCHTVTNVCTGINKGCGVDLCTHIETHFLIQNDLSAIMAVFRASATSSPLT